MLSGVTNLLDFPKPGTPFLGPMGENGMPRYSAETLEAMRKLLLSYRDNMRVEVEQGVGIAAKTVADLRALSFWPPGLILNVHVDLDPTFSVVRVERAS